MAPGTQAPLAKVEALVFDVFGTVVDWRSAVIRELAAMGQRRGLERDWARFADKWRFAYIEGCLKINSGEEPWRLVDEIHHASLVRLLADSDAIGLEEGEIAELSRVWHRLDPWPDSLRGLNRLRSRYILSTLSNGNVSLLVDMAKHGGLPWDCVLSAEMIGRYKPDPSVYAFAARILGRAPEQLMMVAAHAPDLEAARACGLRTGFVERPDEYGRGKVALPPKEGDAFDVHARDLEDLATQLGAA